MANPIDELMAVLVPSVGSLVSAASTYYILDIINFPSAELLAGIVFVFALMQSWGDDSIDNVM
ncbi:hypothetical protein [His2 virus]|uniref:Uncharacterized protein n=1 Tax=His 2 virus TaxID=128710 RepID=Q25BC8_HIS2V|nr:hypothetical protein His2V_gp32 [His2 virus]AAQ13815.1 hypothetical protein [His2 virus]